MLIGTGDHGDPIENPDMLNDDVDSERIGALEPDENRMPIFADADCEWLDRTLALPRTGTPSSERFLGLKESSLPSDSAGMDSNSLPPWENPWRLWCLEKPQG